MHEVVSGNLHNGSFVGLILVLVQCRDLDHSDLLLYQRSGRWRHICTLQAGDWQQLSHQLITTTALLCSRHTACAYGARILRLTPSLCKSVNRKNMSFAIFSKMSDVNCHCVRLFREKSSRSSRSHMDSYS